jgi:hypothetical protein
MVQHPLERRWEVIQRILLRALRRLEPQYDSVSGRWETMTGDVDITELTTEISEALGWPPKHMENEQQRIARLKYQEELMLEQQKFRGPELRVIK